MPTSARYYEAAAANTGDDDEEDDYMSNDLLAEIAQAETKKGKNGPKSYVQLRKDAQRRKEEKGYIKPRAEREREAREEGLRRNLMTAENDNVDSSSNGGIDTSDGSASAAPPPSNKALSMMMKMGFKPGEALGRKEPTSNAASTSHLQRPKPGSPKARPMKAFVAEEDEGDDEDGPLAGLGSARSGLGSKKRPSPAALTEDFISLQDFAQEDHNDAVKAEDGGKARGKRDHRLDPIEIQMRAGMPMPECFVSLHYTYRYACRSIRIGCGRGETAQASRGSIARTRLGECRRLPVPSAFKSF